MIIKLISLSVCSDNDLIDGNKPILEQDVDLFIKYYNLSDNDLILNIKSLINNQMDFTFTHKSIINYRQINNRLVSIGIRLDNKIRYINCLRPDIIDKYITNKIKNIANTITSSCVDIILLQDIDHHYILELYMQLATEYSIISPYEIKQFQTNLFEGSLSNYIIYKKSSDITLIDAELRDYGTVGIFNIENKNVHIISGRWPDTDDNRIFRMKNLKQLDNVTINNKMIFIGNTNLLDNETINLSNIKDAVIENKYKIYYTVDKYINKYYPGDKLYMARYDRIYLNDVDLINYKLAFNTYYTNLINEYKNSGYISDHFGLFVTIYV